MIRDPSDGSVREVTAEEDRLLRKALAASGTVVQEPLLDAIKAALLAGKVKPDRVSEEWAYQRAWNDGIDFSLRQIGEIFKGSGKYTDGQ